MCGTPELLSITPAVGERRRVDILTDILSSFRLEVEIINNAQYCGDWGIDTSGGGYVSFHMVTHGHCYARSAHLTQPQKLDVGDFILFPHDAAHVLESELGCGVALNQQTATDYAQGIQADGVGLLCGYFRFTQTSNNPLLAMLPPVLLKQLRYSPPDCQLASLLTLIKHEALQRQAGSQAAITRLTEALFVLMLREHLADTDNLPGLAAALADERLCRALDMIHRQPEKSWNDEDLGDVAHMSRSAFADLFKRLVGESPISYLSRWRMQNAAQWLHEGSSLYAVAQRCGYESEAAFAKAFKRVTGKTPGQARNQA